MLKWESSKFVIRLQKKILQKRLTACGYEVSGNIHLILKLVIQVALSIICCCNNINQRLKNVCIKNFEWSPISKSFKVKISFFYIYKKNLYFPDTDFLSLSFSFHRDPLSTTSACKLCFSVHILYTHLCRCSRLTLYVYVRWREAKWLPQLPRSDGLLCCKMD